MNKTFDFDFELFQAPLYFITLKTVVLAMIADAFIVSGWHYILEHDLISKLKNGSRVYDPIEQEQPSHVHLVRIVFARNKIMCAKILVFSLYIIVNLFRGKYQHYPALQILIQLLNSHVWMYYFDINISHSKFNNYIGIQVSIFILVSCFFVNIILSTLSYLVFLPAMILCLSTVSLFAVVRHKIFNLAYREKLEHSIFKAIVFDYRYVMVVIAPLFSSAMLLQNSWLENFKYYFWNWVFPRNWSWLDFVVIL